MSLPLPAKARWQAVDPAAAGLVLLTCLVLAGYGFDLGGRWAQNTASWLLLASLQSAAVVLATTLARRPDIAPPIRRFWLLSAAAFGFFLIGTISEVWRGITNPTESIGGSTTFQLALLGCGGLTLLTAMLAHPVSVRERRERLRFWLDIATVLSVGTAYAWYLAGPSLESEALSLTEVGRGLAAPGLFVLILFGLVKLALSAQPPFSGLGTMLAGTAAILEAVSSGLHRLLLESDHFAWSMVPALLANIALLAALRVQQRRTQTEGARPRRTRRVPYSRLPYLALASSFVLLCWDLATLAPSTRTWVVFAGTSLSAGLVVVRQLAALADNAALLVQLDGKVKELAAVQTAMQRALDERDRLAAELREQASHDGLTGLVNRTQFLESLNSAIRRWQISGHPLGVLMIDLDGFKAVNDRFGHRAGDRLLQAVGERISATVRRSDLVARLGGDEFAVLIQPVEELNPLVIRLTDAVREVAQPIDPRTAAHVSASIGAVRSDEQVLAKLLQPGYDAEDLLQIADLRMYEEKESAKSRMIDADSLRSRTA